MIEKRALRPYPEPYPDYGRSLVSQHRFDPQTGAYLGAAGGAIAGGTLGGLTARALTDDDRLVALAAILTAVLGGKAGHYAGSRDRESRNTRLLAMRRAGIDNPAELELLKANPMLAYRLTDKGSRV